MDKKSSLGDSSPHSSGGVRNSLLIVVGICLLSAAVYAYLAFRRPENGRDATRVEAMAKEPMAELVSATGMILTGRPGRTEWNQITVGAHLMEGDLIQTDKSGSASIRYSNGNTVTIQEDTVLTIRSNGDGSMEIGTPSMGILPPSADIEGETENPPQTTAGLENRGAVEAFNVARADESGPYIKLDGIVPFGRSLELIGNVEAGSRLSVNDEIVDVAGDGSFKHFTNPFPGSVQKANLVMKVTDLAGRTRIVTAVHDFNPRARNH